MSRAGRKIPIIKRPDNHVPIVIVVVVVAIAFLLTIYWPKLGTVPLN
jgi:hypothetical protein